MVFSLSEITASLLAYKYLILFPISIIEGPVVTIIAGFLASLGYINFFLAYFAVIMGDVVGDFLLYLIGRKGRSSILSKHGHHFGVTEEKLKFFEKKFGRHTRSTLLFGKFTHAFGFMILVAAGAANVNVWEFVIVNLLGTMVKSFVLLLVGYYFGQFYGVINLYLNDAVIGGFIVFFAFVIGYLVFSRVTKKVLKK